MGRRTISILGVTGSVGQSTARVVAHNAERFDVVAVTAHRKARALARLAVDLGARIAVVAEEAAYPELREALAGTGVEAACGASALRAAAAEPADVVMAAIVGMAGLEPLMHAIAQGRAVAIANKEPLVAAGALVMAAARRHGTAILPVDSEHNAIFQVFNSDQRSGIERLILTASGGPFRIWSAERMAKATPAEAVAHPNWSMGAKISVDSASMMNKALEVIEAHHLFGMPAERIDVVIHPESVVHSLVEYKDGSMLAQLGAPDMCTPIAHVLGWPERMATPGSRLDIKSLSMLRFEAPDPLRFPALGLAYDALRAGATACIALNAANEVAVEAFLNEEISFPGIVDTVRECLEKNAPQHIDTLEAVRHLDEKVREAAKRHILDKRP